MKKLDKPYSGPNAIFPQYYRDSRHAFGSRFQVNDKQTPWSKRPSAWGEWAFCLIGIAAGVSAVIFIAGQA